MERPGLSDFLNFDRSELLIGLGLSFVVLSFMPIALSDILLESIGIFDMYVYLVLLFLIGFASIFLADRESGRKFASFRIFSLVLISTVAASGYASYTILQDDFLINSDAYIIPIIFLSTVSIGAIIARISQGYIWT